MIKALIEQLKKEPGNNQREIQRIQIRLNNYNNKFDHWMDKINKSFNVEPAASALGEYPRLWLLIYKILAFLPKNPFSVLIGRPHWLELFVEYHFLQ